ncbi:homoserine O-acetyltransferase [Microthyrium microscopicum]|uniref:Homoserine O-acetyltransferase n=1 Tax=Microthyrium microscopicum TaxID=703497 RepID=A0A6A6UDK2_9PEZI|nr:homoserine O-acetyltransferase [Microthyrium microscopicum]
MHLTLENTEATLLDTHLESQNLYSEFIRDQNFAVIPSFILESGEELLNCQIAYKTWGQLSARKDNVLVVCHALTGSSDLVDWWRPLFGPGKALDPTRYFIFSANTLGSPYGSSSALTLDPRTKAPYGSNFPNTTIRDDVRAQKLVLDALGIISVAAAVGGSMGGMHALEWTLCTPRNYVKSLVAVATSLYHSAWGIAWAETQRQAIYMDPVFDEGNYEQNPMGQPAAGMTAARMIAMLTYRSSESFVARFGRKENTTARQGVKVRNIAPHLSRPVSANKNIDMRPLSRNSDPYFSVQGYLDYQGSKFLSRFDANCYLHLLKKMDSHDICRGRTTNKNGISHSDDVIKAVCSRAPFGALVVGVSSDVLFPVAEQKHIVDVLPEAKLRILQSRNGHDGFLLEFEELNRLIIEHLQGKHPEMYKGAPTPYQVPSLVYQRAPSMVGEME